MYYDPRVFLALRSVLQWFKRLAKHPHIWEEGAFRLDAVCWKALQSLSFDRMMQRQIQQNTKENQVRHQLFVWFDGFRTMKFIHFLTKYAYPKQRFATLSLPKFDEIRE